MTGLERSGYNEYELESDSTLLPVFAMPSLRPMRRTLAVLALPAALACNSATAPETFVEQYELRQLGSQSMPATPFPGLSIVADTLRMRADGTGERVVWYRFGGNAAAERTHSELTWVSFGDSLEISIPCNDIAFASCIAPPHLAGRLRMKGQLVVPRATIFAGSEAVYQSTAERRDVSGSI